MFVEYFHLAEQPFGATPDPRFLFRTNSHREALASLYCGFYGNRCFTALIAEPGMGKTTLLFDFLDGIRDRARTAFLFNTLCDSDDILSYILYDLGVTPASSSVERHRQLNEILAAETRSGRRVVVVIDEAQNLSSRSLEAVRLLTDFETPRSKLMHVVLAGQPELAEKLAAAEASQLFQRVSTLCRLTLLTPAETKDYVAHRLQVAGYTGASLFTADAIQLLAQESRGIPRIINTLCYNSLCLCRAYKAKQVEQEMVSEAVADLHLPAVRQEEAVTATPVESHLLASFEQHRQPRRTIVMASLCAAVAVLVIGVAMAAVHIRNMRVDAHSVALPVTGISTGSQNSKVGTGGANPRSATPPDSHQITDSMPGIPSQTTFQASPFQPGDVSRPSVVTIVAGDTLVGITKKYLGTFDESLLRQIQSLNPGITDPNHIESGRIIRLPGRNVTAQPNIPQRTQP